MRTARLRRLAYVVVLSLAPAGASGGARVVHPDAGQYVVVVHAANPTRVMARDAVSRLFLKKVRRWPDGTPVQPVDLPDTSRVRAAFSRDVLRRDVPSVKAYWQQRIFSGLETPPPERVSDADALAYVRAHAGAVAYVAPYTALPADVRALEVTR